MKLASAALASLLLILALSFVLTPGFVCAAEEQEPSGPKLAAQIAASVPLATEQAAAVFAAEQELPEKYDVQDALVLACALKRPGIVRYLLEEAGAIAAERSPSYGVMPLHAASFNNSVECAALLLQHGADAAANIGGDEGTPLHQAAMGKASDTAALLLAFTPDLDARNGLGVTALHDAANSDAAEIVQLLLDAGADVNVLTEVEGNTALLLAANRHSLAAGKVLLANGADVNFADPQYKLTALHLAALSGDIEFTRILLAAGADKTLRSSYDATAYDYAASGDNPELAELLK